MIIAGHEFIELSWVDSLDGRDIHILVPPSEVRRITHTKDMYVVIELVSGLQIDSWMSWDYFVLKNGGKKS